MARRVTPMCQQMSVRFGRGEKNEQIILASSHYLCFPYHLSLE